jgi:hypothetical protein
MCYYDYDYDHGESDSSASFYGGTSDLFGSSLGSFTDYFYECHYGDLDTRFGQYGYDYLYLYTC